jgi:hypothetical protein
MNKPMRNRTAETLLVMAHRFALNVETQPDQQSGYLAAFG